MLKCKDSPFEACIAIQAQVSAVQAGNSRGELFKLLPAAPNPKDLG